MLEWIIKNYKAAIALFTVIVTSILTPLITIVYSTFVKIDTTHARVDNLVMENQARKEEIRTIERTYASSARVIEQMANTLKTIEERQYQELKEARQFRRALNP